MVELKTTMNSYEKHELQQRLEENCLDQEVIIISETACIKNMKGEHRGRFLFEPRYFRSVRRVIMLKESGNMYEYSYNWEASEKIDYMKNVKVAKVQVDSDILKETIREEFLMTENKMAIDCTEDELDINAKIMEFKETDEYIEYEYKMINWDAIISKDEDSIE